MIFKDIRVYAFSERVSNKYVYKLNTCHLLLFCIIMSDDFLITEFDNNNNQKKNRDI